MAIVINGSGTVTGLAVGGLPDDSVDEGSLANSINTSIGAKLPLAGGTVTGNVIHNDNVKALFGTGNDLEIYHDGAHNRLQCPTGELKLRASAVRLGSVAGENGINMVGDGAVELYHNNAKKIETTATGVTVTGAIGGATNLGKVLQVVNYTLANSSAISTSNTSYTAASGVEVAITPSTTNSKILILFMTSAYKAANGIYIALYRDGSSVFTNGSGPTGSHNPSFHYLHSPSTDSETTYQIYFKAGGSGAAYLKNNEANVISLTAMEIGA